MNLATPPFTLRQIQYALAVAEVRNFRRAAELCAVAQPSLSSQLAALEEALGVVLFERGRGGVRTTPAGKLLLARMRQMLRESDDLVREARGFQDPFAGSLRLGVIPTIAPYLLPQLVPALKKAFPKLTPLWTEDRTQPLVAALERGELEGGILALEADLGTLEVQALGRDPFVACLPPHHPLTRRKGRTLRLDDLDGERLLLLEDGHCLRDQALAACGRAKVEELGFRTTSLPTLVQMVSSGAGITLLPRLSVPTETARAAVVLRSLAAPVPFRTLALVWRRGSFAQAGMPRIAAVAKEVVKGFGGM
jgi:LysR family hydrogen peroxide-inducible transcriptional activator